MTPIAEAPEVPELFEITTLAVKDKIVFDLNNANDKPLFNAAGERLSVTICGPGTKLYSKAHAVRAQRMMDRAISTRRGRAVSEDAEDDDAEFLAAITTSFNGWGYKGANDPKAILAAYKDRTIGFIADQISKAVGDWANFLKSGIES